MSRKCGLCQKDNAKASCGACKEVSYCNRECQIKDWNRHKLECKKQQKTEEKKEDTLPLEMDKFVFTLPAFNDELIQIKESTLHGYGMFAACDISKGTVICAEKAMMVLPDYAKHKMSFYLRQQFILLSQSQKNIYKSLSYPKKNENMNDSEQLLAIWGNNQIKISERKCFGLFGLISRVNHSCKCNAHWIWNNDLSQQRLIALKDIKKESEILVNYLIEPMVSKERKSELSKSWNILCECEWCKNEQKCVKMDLIIEEYENLNKRMENMISAPLEGYKSARRVISIVEKYFDGCANLLHKHCYDAAQFALGLQKWSEASYYLETSLKEKEIAFGQDVDVRFIDDGFMEKVNMLPTKFQSRFKKFDPKYRAKLSKNINNDDVDKKKNVTQNVKKQQKKTQNGKKTNNKNKAKNKQKNQQKNKKNKKKKTRK